MRLVFTLLTAILSFELANAVSSPPSGSITIGPSGSGAKYTSLTTALADTSSSVYFVYSGTYSGQHYINRADITIYGQSSNALAYSSNTVTFSNARNSSEAGSNDAGATIRIASSANNVKLYNLNIANTWGAGVQAVALSVQSTGNFACYACQLKGYQDTLLSNQGFQFYGKTYIEGAVDFIFGQRASVWFYGSTIKTLGSGYITASGRDSNDSAWYVIDHSTVTGTGTQYLGRPWRSWARVVFQYTSLPSTIPAAGWSQWSSSTPNTENIQFSEYNNTGAGAWKSGRASFATLLTTPISITTVLGSTSWIDQAYLAGGTSTSSTSTSTSTATSTSTSTTTTTTTTTSSGGTGCTAAQWAQCGGSGFSGCTICVAGTTCTYQNEWYSQCL